MGTERDALLLRPGGLCDRGDLRRLARRSLALPAQTSVGFTTGTQMAAFTALAAARHHLLMAQGWDVEADGLWGARIPVLASSQRHSIDHALRYLGMGTQVRSIACDADGAIQPEDLVAALEETERPPIVCVQAGNINTGAVDPLVETCTLVHAHGGWVHVDGAIGLWALASAGHREYPCPAPNWPTRGRPMLTSG